MTAAVMVNQGLSNSWVLNTISNYNGSSYEMDVYCTDNSGNIYQLSGQYYDTTYAYQTAYAVSKIRPDGSVAWQNVISKTTSPSSNQYFNHIAVLPNGNVAIAAWEFIDSPISIALIVLSSSDGSIVSQKRIRWTDYAAGTKGNLKGLHIDSAGNYYLVQQSAGSVAFFLTKLNSSFAVQWQIGSSSNDDFGLGTGGNYQIKQFSGNSSGTTVILQSFDYFTSPRKGYTYITVVNSSGTVVWKKWFSSALGMAVDMDSDGNVYSLLMQSNKSYFDNSYAYWNSQPQQNYNYILVKFDAASGIVLWTKAMADPQRVYNGTNYVMTPIAVNATTDSVFMTATQTSYVVTNGGTGSQNPDAGATNSGNYGSGIIVHKLNSSNGTLLWRNKATLSSITPGATGAYAYAVDTTYNVNYPTRFRYSAVDGQRKIIGMKFTYSATNPTSYTGPYRQASLVFKVPDNNLKTFTNLSIGNNTQVSYTEETGMDFSTYVWPSNYVYMGTSGVTFSSSPYTSYMSVSDYSAGFWSIGLQNVYVTNSKTNLP